MHVARSWKAQGTLEQDLACGVVGQVRATHDVGDALRSVVYHHGELVSPQTVGTVQHEVAHLLRHVLVLSPEKAVLPRQRRGQF